MQRMGRVFTLSSDGGGIHGNDAIWVEVDFLDASSNTLALYRSTVVTSSNLAQSRGYWRRRVEYLVRSADHQPMRY